MPQRLCQLKHKDLKPLREKWYTDQNGECPILKQKFPIEEMVIDHQHKLKSEEPDSTGKGLCRGCIHNGANVLEGKITNAFKRYGLGKHIDLPFFLRNLADYLEDNRIKETVKYIHPSEKPKPRRFSKVRYNRLVRAVDGRQRVPKYTGRLTVTLQRLLDKYQID